MPPLLAAINKSLRAISSIHFKLEMNFYCSFARMISLDAILCSIELNTKNASTVLKYE